MFVTPHDIEIELKKKIIGQQELVKTLSIIGFLHSIRPQIAETEKLRKKETLLVMGPSGSGKTYGVNCLASLLGLPFLHVNATEITKSGYVGDTLADMIEPYKDQAEFNRMIIFIDEFDKISSSLDASKSENWNASVQHSILTVMEGGAARTEARSIKSGTVIDTSKMLIILGGAFEFLRKEEESQKNEIGFHETKKPIKSLFEQRSKLEKGGLIKEIVGRITAIVKTDKVSNEMLKEMVNNKFSSLEEYKKLLEIYNIRDLEMTEEDFKELFEQAKDLDIGGRIVDAFIFQKIQDIIYKEIKPDLMDN